MSAQILKFTKPMKRGPKIRSGPVAQILELFPGRESLRGMCRELAELAAAWTRTNGRWTDDADDTRQRWEALVDFHIERGETDYIAALLEWEIEKNRAWLRTGFR